MVTDQSYFNKIINIKKIYIYIFEKNKRYKRPNSQWRLSLWIIINYLVSNNIKDAGDPQNPLVTIN